MKLSALYQIFLECQSVTTDSRNCPDGSLFIALKGESFNGNTFAKSALDSGCAYAMIDEAEYAVEGDQRYILVDNCLLTMQQLANYHRRQLGTKVIGITGTNGKTTTKELTAAVLSTSFNVLYTQGNLNNHIGVPLTLLRLQQEHEIAVIEMGASHPGDIRELVEIADPDYGLITNIGKAHLEGFGSFEGVMATKGELYDYLKQKADSKVFVHEDNPYLSVMSEGLTKITYGSANGLYVSGHTIGNSPFLTFEWKAAGEADSHHVQTQLIGDYNLPNALAAITVGHYFGVDADKADKALEAYIPGNNRSQLKRTAHNTLIIDAYNANPTSMRVALENFRHIETKRKMLIAGDMRELGTDSLSEHKEIIDYVNECQFDTVWLVGSQFAACQSSFRTFADAQTAIQAIENERPEGYTILIKGSNGVKLATLIDYL